MAERLSRRALNRATLARQWLLQRARATAIEAVEHLVGLQAQAPFAPYYGLWSRLEDFEAVTLGQALIDGRLARAVVMRGTLHLVSARDCESLRALTQPIMDRDLRQNVEHRHALAGLDHARLSTAASAVLAQGPLTPKELGLKLHEAWPDIPPVSLAHAARGLLCLVQTPPRGVWGQSGATRLALARDVLPTRSSRPQTLADLARHFLAAFGPASVRDFQTWSGLPRLQGTIDALGPDLLSFESETGEALFDLPDAPRPGEDISAPVRLVAPFDNLLLGYADRHRVMDDETRKRLFAAKNGLIPGALLIDGFVAGAWDLKAKTLRVTPYAKIPSTIEADIAAEARRLLDYAGLPNGRIEVRQAA